LATAQVQVYNGRYTAATPCANITYVADASGRAPHASVLVYLTPGLHDVVVTTTDPTDAGVFAVHADRAIWTGATSASSPVMYEQYSGSSSCSSSSSGGTYTYYSWTATNTTMLDIVVFSYNSTIQNNDFVATLYNSSNLAGLGTGNTTNPVDLCIDAYWQQTVYAETSINKVNQDFFAAGTFTGVSVTAGQNYTIVISSYTSLENYIYGIWTRPTLLGRLGTTLNYYRPNLNTDTCVNGSSPFYWDGIVFTAQQTTYVMDNGNSPNSFDTAACLYSGNNEGSRDQTVAPLGCSATWLQCIDTGDIGPLHQLGTVPGRNYTIVQTSYSAGGGSGASYDYMLWFYTGTQLGPLPVTTTGVETTVMGSSSSDATMIVASLALTFAAFFF